MENPLASDVPATSVMHLIYLAHLKCVTHLKYMTHVWYICDLSLDLKCHYEKNRFAIAIVEVISLSTSFILLIALHFHYVFMLVC